MRLEVALPVVLPLLFGALSVALWRWRTAQRITAVVGTGVLLLAAIWLLMSVWNNGVLAIHMGDWRAPFGIVLVADLLSAIMVVLAAITGLATAVYSLTSISQRHEHYGYYPLLHLLLVGVNGAFLTGDIFNMYVWFEVMLVASFALLILGGERAQMEGAIKYVTLNLLSSALFLTGIALIYGLTGTLNMADIADKLSTVEETGLVTVIGMLFMISFAIKAGAFPFFFWLPASYHTPQVAVSALFAALLTKVGVYALFRAFTLIFNQDVGYTHEILLWVAGATMLTGVLGAAAQFEFRRILSFHIISQIGYMLMGLALYTPLAIIGGVFYIMHHIIVKANLFLVAGLVYKLKGSYELKELGSVYRERPMLGFLFLVPALSLAGIPPLSGFFAKFILIRAGVEAESWGIVFVALLVGLLTLYSMIKIWAEAFWKAQPEEFAAKAPANPSGVKSMYFTIAAMASLTVFIGLWGQPIYLMAEAAALQLLDPRIYIDAVLGEGS
ncbi:multisubunit sodium/proton antiporter, MrpD subunit [Ectothiorhodosinus mongolicus]|uniref:Multisubunit sodium/proton antiporter, MrpD subunit n=1 Tax=Ectothiorhodosinus mongolicus TaxID=233100 RepID=A0A1R3W4R2_9GAMM|nr:Na+/H+ antiporter subunit D [Ectothiorhodosinus mongolicus]ULX57411.1 Na+/H+ antiporter subunit D [Ectothiorhodosinus mongolicus]SIT72050.1 multisubunit sodium/proton antiporter, MrpD subunit [Ectothiorhodosinus mongolicus]